MDFKKAALISNYISKEYAERIFKLIVSYKDISASEAASRLDMHIRTIQEFLDTMAQYGILDKNEVYEKKRPYFRYSIKKKKIEIIIDLDEVFFKKEEKPDVFKIREIRNSGVKFSLARNGECFSTASIWQGDSRDGKERKINLTSAQGQFLYYLPFPDTSPLSIDEIILKSDIEESHKSEILDIINELFSLKVIEKII